MKKAAREIIVTTSKKNKKLFEKAGFKAYLSGYIIIVFRDGTELDRVVEKIKGIQEKIGFFEYDLSERLV